MQISRLLSGGLPLFGLLICRCFALSPEEVVEDIYDVIRQSSDLQGPAASLTPFNAIIQGPYVIEGFQKIVQDLNQDSFKWQGGANLYQSTEAKDNGPPFNDPKSAQSISDSFRAFVANQQQLLNILIAKRPCFTDTPALEPMTEILRALESTIDTIGFTLIDLVPPRSNSVKEDRNKIEKTLAAAIQTYSNPDYPVDEQLSRDEFIRYSAPNKGRVKIYVEM